MWVIFLGSGMAFGIAALVLVWIGSRVILSIRRQQKKFEIEDETYNKVKEAMEKAMKQFPASTEKVLKKEARNIAKDLGVRVQETIVL